MNHKERMKIAKEIARRLVKKYKKDIVAITLYGSTARNQDKKYSDIEFNVFTKRPIKLKSKEYLFKEIVIGIYVDTIKDKYKKIEDVGWLWPLEMAAFTNNKLLYGDKNLLPKIQNKINSISLKRRMKSVEEFLPSLIEVLNKVRQTNNIYNLTEYSREILYQVNQGVAHINKSIFTRNYYDNWKPVFQYSKLPKNYESLVHSIFLCKEPKKMKHLLHELVENHIEFLERDGIKKKVYTDLSFL